MRLDRPADARSALVAARDGWHPTSGEDEAELNFVAALVERDLGRLDVAEQLAASAVRLRNGTSDRRAALVERIALAQVHVLAGERDLRMAESVICDGRSSAPSGHVTGSHRWPTRWTLGWAGTHGSWRSTLAGWRQYRRSHPFTTDGALR